MLLAKLRRNPTKSMKNVKILNIKSKFKFVSRKICTFFEEKMGVCVVQNAAEIFFLKKRFSIMSERAIVEDVDDDGAVVEAGEDAVEVLSDEEADAQSVTEAAAAAAAAADEPIPTALDEHVVPDLGLTVAYPRGWHAWTSAEFGLRRRAVW